MNRAIADRLLAAAARLYVGNRISILSGGAALPAGPVLFAANHPTTLDPVLLLRAAGRPCSALLTEAAFALPGIGAALRGAGNLPVGDKSAGGEFLVEAAAALLGEGRSVAIFPEGRLSGPGGPGKLRSGAVRIAAKARSSIVPVGIFAARGGAREIPLVIAGKEERGRYFLRGWYCVRFGEALRFDLDPADPQAVREATARLGAAIGRLAAEARSIVSLVEGSTFESVLPAMLAERAYPLVAI